MAERSEEMRKEKIYSRGSWCGVFLSRGPAEQRRNKSAGHWEGGRVGAGTSRTKPQGPKPGIFFFSLADPDFLVWDQRQLQNLKLFKLNHKDLKPCNCLWCKEAQVIRLEIELVSVSETEQTNPNLEIRVSGRAVDVPFELLSSPSSLTNHRTNRSTWFHTSPH